MTSHDHDAAFQAFLDKSLSESDLEEPTPRSTKPKIGQESGDAVNTDITPTPSKRFLKKSSDLTSSIPPDIRPANDLYAKTSSKYLKGSGLLSKVQLDTVDTFGFTTPTGSNQASPQITIPRPSRDDEESDSSSPATAFDSNQEDEEEDVSRFDAVVSEMNRRLHAEPTDPSLKTELSKSNFEPSPLNSPKTEENMSDDSLSEEIPPRIAPALRAKDGTPAADSKANLSSTMLPVSTVSNQEEMPATTTPKVVVDESDKNEALDRKLSVAVENNKPSLPPPFSASSPAGVKNAVHKKDRVKRKAVKGKHFLNRANVALSSLAAQQQWSPKKVVEMKSKGLSAQPELDVLNIRDDHLRASVESFSVYLRDHFSHPGAENVPTAVGIGQGDFSVLESERKEMQLRVDEAQRQISKLRIELVNTQKQEADRLAKLQKQYEDELYKLKQEVFVLSAKLAAKEQPSRLDDSIEKSQLDVRLAQLESEVREQEQLILGYQKENEKLYRKVETGDREKKRVMDATFSENQKLKVTVATLEEQIEQKDAIISELRSKVVDSGIVYRSKDLLAVQEHNRRLETELDVFKQKVKTLEQESTKAKQISRIPAPTVFSKSAGTSIVKLRKQVELLTAANKRLDEELNNKESQLSRLMSSHASPSILQRENQTLNMQLSEYRVRERDLQHQLVQMEQRWEEHSSEVTIHKEELEKQIQIASSDRSKFEQRISDLTEEIENLNSKLQWWSDNQQLIDKTAVVLKDKNVEIETLRAKVDSLQIKLQHEPSDGKARIRQLETQVKELEEVLKKRLPPDSVGMLMWLANREGGTTAASFDPSKSTGLFPDANSQQRIDLLERSLARAETRLASNDEQSNLVLRGMQQQFATLQIKYTQRIEHLEHELNLVRQSPMVQTLEPDPRVEILEKELDVIQDRYQQRIATLEQELNKFQNLYESQRVAHPLSETKTVSQKPKQTAPVRGVHPMVEAVHMRDLEDQLNRLKNENRSLIQKLKQERRTKKKTNTTALMKSTATASGDFKRYRPNTYLHEHTPVGAQKAAEIVVKPVVSKQSVSTETETDLSPVSEETVSLRSKISELELQLTKEKASRQEAEAANVAMAAEEQSKRRMLLTELGAEHQRKLEAAKSAALNENAQHQSKEMIELRRRLEQRSEQLDEARANLLRAEMAKEKGVLREQKLEDRIQKLLQELSSAKQAGPPQRRDYESLEAKLTSLEERYAQRVMNLKQMMKPQARHNDSRLFTDSGIVVDDVELDFRSNDNALEKVRSELNDLLYNLEKLKREQFSKSQEKLRKQ